MGWVRARREEVMGDAEGGQHRRAARSHVCSYRDKNTYKRHVVQVLEEAITHNPDSGVFFFLSFFSCSILKKYLLRHYMRETFLKAFRVQYFIKQIDDLKKKMSDSNK